MSEITLSRIFIYPVKSLGGIELRESPVEARGLRHDRRWLLTDAAGMFLTQRQHPRMALVRVSIADDAAGTLEVSAPGAGTQRIPQPPPDAATAPVQIWRNVCEAQAAAPEVNRWFSDFLGLDCRAVFMPETTRRPVNPDYARNDDIVSFADGYPVLVIGEASLDDLNRRLPHPLPLDRFRPNLVVSGVPAFAEDDWDRIEVGSAVFHGAKPCERCTVTTVNQATGEAEGPEPLRTLAEYRRRENKVLFGANLLVGSSGRVKVNGLIAVPK